jgi:hypothetical protein
MLRPRADRYTSRYPTVIDVLLLIEVGDSTLRFDRDRKAKLYARHRVGEQWIVDLVHRQLHLSRKPRRGGYADATEEGGGFSYVLWCEYGGYPYYPVECYYLQESFTGGAWTRISAGGGSKAFSGKPPGTYQYRVNYTLELMGSPWDEYVVVWIVQLLLSPLWLSHFRSGPFEWLWRSLTYGRAQPWRRAFAQEAPA